MTETADPIKSQNHTLKFKLILASSIIAVLGLGRFIWHDELGNEDQLEQERIAEQERLEKELVSRRCESNDKACQIYQKSGVVLIELKGGSLMMGSEDESSDGNEKPKHRVEVRDFYISKTEVTVGQYRKCVEAGICSRPISCDWGTPIWTDHIGNLEKHPVNCVDWNQARTFARWIGGDLPTEAQWEYAARSGGKETKYPWGNMEATCEYAVMSDPKNGCGRDLTWEVCSKTKGNTTQGLCDMSGNVYEWVLDEWHDSYDGAPSDDKGWCSDELCESQTSSSRVYRGGAWYDLALALRATDRLPGSASLRNYTLGFRVSY
jgi:formylglycine-generating enzyme required for sulfatase activity